MSHDPLPDPAVASVVIVTFNSAHCLERAVHSVPRGVEIIVVDNASADGSAKLAERLGCRVVRNTRNAGFGVACNAGAAVARGGHVLFLNPDATLEPGALDALLQAAADHPHAAGFEADLVMPGTAPAGKSTGGGAVTPVETLRGAALFVRKADFDAVGGFDPDIFLYFEDTDLSLRLARRGPLLRVIGARAIHHPGHGAALSIGQRFTKYRHYAHSRTYFGRKHGQRHDYRLAALEQIGKAAWAAVRLRFGHAAQHLGRGVGYVEAYYSRPAPRDDAAAG